MAESFIGSIISLVSKSDIRYEGVVSSINAADSTIKLKNVKSFGSEGRKTDGPQIPPSDSIYESILFRASDIQDLQVKASPPVPRTLPTFNNPAIIEMHSSSNSYEPSGVPPMPNFSNEKTMQKPTMNTHSPPVSGKPTASSPIPLKNLMPSAPYRVLTPPPLVTPSHFLPPQPLQSADKSVEVALKSQPPLLPLPSQLLRKSSVGSSSTHQDNRGRGNRNFQPAATFPGEFDFKAMNEKFNKEEIWGQLGKNNEAEEGKKFLQDGKDYGSSESEALPVYAKDGFFDLLSCTSLDNGWRNQRIKYSERIKLDTETFGDVARKGDGRGIHGPKQGGHTSGGYTHGTGIGYTGRGRGRHS